MGKADLVDLEEVADPAERGDLEIPIGRVVPLSAAIAALTDLETNETPRGRKLVVAMG